MADGGVKDGVGLGSAGGDLLSAPTTGVQIVCLGVLVLVCVLLAAGVVVWFFRSVQDKQQDRDRVARAATQHCRPAR